MKHVISFAVTGLIFLTCSCSVPQYTMKETPDIADINLMSGNYEEGEFICLIDSSLLVNIKDKETKNSRAYLIPANKIKYLEIEGYSSSNWIYGLLISEAIPAVLIGVAAGQIEKDNSPIAVVGVCAIPFVINAVLFLASNKPIEFEQEDISGDLSGLMPFAFYPGGIPKDKLDTLLKTNNQEYPDSTYFY
jgi:hypothetical protein